MMQDYVFVATIMCYGILGIADKSLKSIESNLTGGKNTLGQS